MKNNEGDSSSEHRDSSNKRKTRKLFSGDVTLSSQQYQSQTPDAIQQQKLTEMAGNVLYGIFLEKSGDMTSKGLADKTEDTYTNVEKTTEQTQGIKKHLNDLPALCDIPKERWWPLYIDATYHEDAKTQSDPGKFFDQDRSPGYKQGIIEALDTFVAQKKPQNKELDYNLYTDIHKCVTKYIRHKDFGYSQSEWMGKSNGVSSDGPFTFARLDPIPNSGPERQERLAALQEMSTEYINGMPLYIDHPDYNREKQEWSKPGMNKDNTYDFLEYICDHGFMNLKNNAPNMQEIMEELHIDNKPQGIIMGITSTHDASIGMIPLYSPDKGPEIVSACLRQYNDSKNIPNQSEDQILKSIARLIRNLHMVHQKYDGMGRTNTCILLNKELVERGFCPTILPNSPGVFGGLKTLDGLLQDIKAGMAKYREIAKKPQEIIETSKLPSQQDSLQNVDKKQDNSIIPMDKIFNDTIEAIKTDDSKSLFKEHTLQCLKEGKEKEWLKDVHNKIDFIYHGMDVINDYEHRQEYQEYKEPFKKLFMENSKVLFTDSPPDERFKIDKQDSPGKVFLEWHGIDFFNSYLGKEWLKLDQGKWLASYSGKIFKKRHKQDFTELSF